MVDAAIHRARERTAASLYWSAVVVPAMREAFPLPSDLPLDQAPGSRPGNLESRGHRSEGVGAKSAPIASGEAGFGHSTQNRYGQGVQGPVRQNVGGDQGESSKYPAPARSAGASLEKVILTDTGLYPGRSKDDQHWNIKSIDYPDGGSRISAYRGRLGGPPGRKINPGRSVAPKIPRQYLSLKRRSPDSVAQSRGRVRHLCRALSARYLWTAGKRDLFPTLDQAENAWAKFSRLGSVRYGPKWRYVVVWEEKPGGWHIHFAVADFLMADTLRLLWHKALGADRTLYEADSPGNVDAVDKGRGTSSAKRIAGYISKYIGKDGASVPAYRRSFASTKGLGDVPVRRLCGAWGEGLKVLRVEIESALGKPIGLGRYSFRHGVLFAFWDTG